MLLIALYAVAILVPTGNAALLNGLPLDSLAEVVALLLVLPLVVSADLRASWLGMLAGRRRTIAYAVLVGLITLKGAALAGGADGAFRACYRSPAGLEPIRCERSFADPLRLSGATRFDARLDFPAAPSLVGSRWDLDWVNRLTYNRRLLDTLRSGRPGGGVPRERMPFTVTWTGALAKPVPRVVRIVYAGEGRVDLGDGPHALPPSYERVRGLRLAVPAGADRLRVDFRFVSQRGDADRPGPYAAFKLLDARRGTPVTAARAPWTLAAATLAAVLAALATMLLSYGRALGPAGLARVAAAVVAGTALGLATGAPGLVTQGGSAAAGLCVGAVLCAQSVRPWRHPLLVAFLALCGLMVVMALTADFEPSAVLYQPYGEDWLAYQGHAHTILDTGSAEGGEAVFYYMPAMRYVVFAGHVLLGAGDLLPVSVALGLFALSVAFCLTRLVERFAGGTRLQSIAVSRNALVAQAVGGVVTAGLMLLLVTVGVEFLVRAGASESPTWAILPCAVALLFGSSSRAGWAAGSALVGLWVALRLNDLPAAVFLLGLFCAPRDRRPERVALAAAGLGAFLGAILLHNGVYGGELALLRAEPIVAGTKLTNSASGLGALGNFLAAITDPAVRAEIGRHARALLYFPVELRFDLASLAPTVAFHSLQVAWVGAVGWVVVVGPRRAGLTAVGMLLLPLAVLVPYLVFDVTVYYPRQPVLGYVAIGVAVLFTLGRLTAPGHTMVPPPEGPVSTEARAPDRPALEGRPAAPEPPVRRVGRPAERA